jgi:anti-sigma factor RsiW
MNVGPQQRPDGRRPRRTRARAAAWSVSTGVIVGAAGLICMALGAVSAQQAIALYLPGALLIVGGLIAAAIPDAATGQRAGFEAGFRTGWLLSRLRSLFRPPRNGP